jgi:DNA-directed RNA polymerase subunit RPC12/RpoP
MIERLKATTRADGMMQCPRCGCRTMVTETTGAHMNLGKRIGGTVTAKDVCAECYKRGIQSPMQPEIKAV